MKRFVIVLFTFFLCISLNQGCQHEAISDECNISFNRDLLPILTTSCTGYCHASFDHYIEYKNVKEVVDNGLLNEKVVVLKTMPFVSNPDSTSFTEDQRNMFACWIAAGGPNN